MTILDMIFDLEKIVSSGKIPVPDEYKNSPFYAQSCVANSLRAELKKLIEGHEMFYVGTQVGSKVSSDSYSGAKGEIAVKTLSEEERKSLRVEFSSGYIHSSVYRDIEELRASYS